MSARPLFEITKTPLPRALRCAIGLRFLFLADYAPLTPTRSGRPGLLFLALIFACLSSIVEAAPSYENPRFSPDERMLAFDYCNPECRFVVYSLENGTASTLGAQQKSDSWITPSFAPASDVITFAISRGPKDVQIATIKTNGTNFLVWTGSPTVKRYPSFSPDAKTIVFAGRETIENERGKASSYDLYTVNLEKRIERRVTDFRLYSISAPFFLSDGRHVTFSASGTARPRSETPSLEIDLQSLYRDRAVFILPLEGRQELKPFIESFDAAFSPTPIRTGEIALLVRVNDIERITGNYIHDLFLVNSGNTKRHTTFRTYIRSYGISTTGNFVAYVTADVETYGIGLGRTRFKNDSLILWRKQSGESVVITITSPTVIPVRP